MQIISILIALVIALSVFSNVNIYLHDTSVLASQSNNERNDSARNSGKNEQSHDNENKGGQVNDNKRDQKEHDKSANNDDSKNDDRANSSHDKKNGHDDQQGDKGKNGQGDNKEKDDNENQDSKDKNGDESDNDQQNPVENRFVNGNVRISSSGPNVYTVWDRFDKETGQTKDVLFRKSADNGNTFADVKVLGKGSPASVAPQIAAVGQYVFIVWEGISIANDTALNPFILNGDIFLSRSTDYGKTFEEPVNLSHSPASPSYDPHIAAIDNHVYVAWAEAFNSSMWVPEGETYFVNSSDNGSTFSSPLVISGSDQGTMNLQITANRNYVYVVWEARLFDGDPSHYAPAAVTFAKSMDNGHSFEAPTVLSKLQQWAQYPSIMTHEDEVYVTWYSSTGFGLLKSIDNGQSFTRENAFDKVHAEPRVHAEPVLFSISKYFKGETWCDYDNSTCFLHLISQSVGSNITNTFRYPEGCRPLDYKSLENETYALGFCSGTSLLFLKGTVNDTVFSYQIPLGELGFFGDSVQATMYQGDCLFVAWHGADDNLYFKKFCIPLDVDNISLSLNLSDSEDTKADRNNRSSNNDNDHGNAKEKHNDDASKDKNNDNKSDDSKSSSGKGKSTDKKEKDKDHSKSDSSGSQKKNDVEEDAFPAKAAPTNQTSCIGSSQTYERSDIPTKDATYLNGFSISVGVVYDCATNEIYIADSAVHSLSVIDGESNSIIDTIQLASAPSNEDYISYSGPIGLAYDPTHGYILAVNAPYGKVSVISDKSHNIVGTVAIGDNNPTWIAVDPKHGEAYVLHSDTGVLSVLITSTLSVTDNIPLNASAPVWYLAYNSDGYVYAVVLGDIIGENAGVAIIDTETHKVIDFIGIEQDGPRYIEFDITNHRAYVACGSGDVVVIDLNTRSIINTIRIPDTNYGYYYSGTDGSDIVYNRYEDTIKPDTEKIASSPAGMIFNPNNSHLYVVHYGVGMLTAIDTNTMSIVGHTPTLLAGWGIGFNPTNNTIIMTHEATGSVSIITAN